MLLNRVLLVVLVAVAGVLFCGVSRTAVALDALASNTRSTVVVHETFPFVVGPAKTDCTDPCEPVKMGAPPKAYICDCAKPVEHPECNCNSGSNGGNGKQMVTPKMDDSLQPKAAESTVVRPYSHNTGQGTLPALKQSECNPNVEGVRPGNCKYLTNGRGCQHMDSGCNHDSKKNEAQVSHCKCSKPAPAPCSCHAGSASSESASSASASSASDSSASEGSTEESGEEGGEVAVEESGEETGEEGGEEAVEESGEETGEEGGEEAGEDAEESGEETSTS